MPTGHEKLQETTRTHTWDASIEGEFLDTELGIEVLSNMMTIPQSHVVQAHLLGNRF